MILPTLFCHCVWTPLAEPIPLIIFVGTDLAQVVLLPVMPKLDHMLRLSILYTGGSLVNTRFQEVTRRCPKLLNDSKTTPCVRVLSTVRTALQTPRHQFLSSLRGPSYPVPSLKLNEVVKKMSGITNFLQGPKGGALAAIPWAPPAVHPMMLAPHHLQHGSHAPPPWVRCRAGVCHCLHRLHGSPRSCRGRVLVRILPLRETEKERSCID